MEMIKSLKQLQAQKKERDKKHAAEQQGKSILTINNLLEKHMILDGFVPLPRGMFINDNILHQLELAGYEYLEETNIIKVRCDE